MTEHGPNGPSECDDDTRVAENFGCPRCGERRFDFLVWIGEYKEQVECATCGCVYTPGED